MRMPKWQDELVLKDSVSKALEKIDKNTQKTDKTMKKLQFDVKKMEKTSKAFLRTMKAVGISIVGVFAVSGAVGTAMKGVAELGDRIDKTSQKIGMSSKSFQEWDYIMSQNGGNVDSLKMGYKTLVNQMVQADKNTKKGSNAFKELGVNIKDANGHLRNQDDVFKEVVRALQKVQDPLKKAYLANKLFGRSAIEMKPLLEQSADAVDKLREKANKLGLILTDKDIKAAVEFTDTMDTLNRVIQANMARALTSVMPQITELANLLINNSDLLVDVVNFVIKLSSAIVNLAKFISKITPLLAGLTASFIALASPAIATAITGLMGSLMLTAGTLSAPLIGIAVAVGAVTTVIIALWQNWDKCWGFIRKVTSAVAKSVSGFITGLISLIDSLIRKIATVVTMVPSLGGIGSGLASSIGKTISNNSIRANTTTTNNTTTNNNFYGNMSLTGKNSLGAILGAGARVPIGA